MRTQTIKEEKVNAASHAVGALIGIIGFIMMLNSVDISQPYLLFSVITYGLSIVLLFMSSTIYHTVTDERHKVRMRMVDHISIYYLIAGTYTPVLLLILPESRGWMLFWTVWGVAAFGTVLKIFFTGRFETFSTLLYLVMGWLILLDFRALSDLMPAQGITLLVAGGAFYTVGILFYVFDKRAYNHLIWHLFVLGGAICHFFMVYCWTI